MATGLVGLLSGEVMADDVDTGYMDLTPKETLEEIGKKADYLNDSNFKTKVLDSDGAYIVLFIGSCDTGDIPNLNKNQGIVFLQLMDEFRGTKVDSLPLKFGMVDFCKYVDNNHAGRTVYSQKIKGLTTIMYKDGKEIDALVGGPKGEKWIPEWVGFLSEKWIPSNLTHPNGEYAWRFERSYNEHKVSLKP